MAAALIRDFPAHYPLHAVRDLHLERHQAVQPQPAADGATTAVDGVKDRGIPRRPATAWWRQRKQDGMRLVSALLGSASEESRLTETQALLALRVSILRDQPRVYEGGVPITQVRVWQGESPQLEAGVAEDLYLTVPRG